MKKNYYGETQCVKGIEIIGYGRISTRHGYRFATLHAITDESVKAFRIVNEYVPHTHVCIANFGDYAIYAGDTVQLESIYLVTSYMDIIERELINDDYSLILNPTIDPSEYSRAAINGAYGNTEDREDRIDNMKISLVSDAIISYMDILGYSHVVVDEYMEISYKFEKRESPKQIQHASKD